MSNWGLEDTDKAQLQAEITQISSRVAGTIEQVAAERVDFLPAVNGGDSFYAAHEGASAIGWVGASQPAATKAVDLCAAPRPF